MRVLKTVPTMHSILFFCIALCSMAHVRWVVLGEHVFDFDDEVFGRSLHNNKQR